MFLKFLMLSLENELQLLMRALALTVEVSPSVAFSKIRVIARKTRLQKFVALMGRKYYGSDISWK